MGISSLILHYTRTAAKRGNNLYRIAGYSNEAKVLWQVSLQSLDRKCSTRVFKSPDGELVSGSDNMLDPFPVVTYYISYIFFIRWIKPPTSGAVDDNLVEIPPVEVLIVTQAIMAERFQNGACQEQQYKYSLLQLPLNYLPDVGCCGLHIYFSTGSTENHLVTPTFLQYPPKDEPKKTCREQC